MCSAQFYLFRSLNRIRQDHDSGDRRIKFGQIRLALFSKYFGSVRLWPRHTNYAHSVATDDAPSCEVPSRRRTIKPPAWQKDYLLF